MRKNYFTNADICSIIEAEDIVAKETEKLEKSKKGLKISAASTLAWLISTVICIITAGIESYTLADIILFTIILPGFLFAIIGTIVAYVKSGGFLETLKIIGKIGFVGWFIIPFPFDLITGFFVMFYTAIAFFVCPVSILGIVHLIRKKRIKKANEYLTRYAQVQSRMGAFPETQPVDVPENQQTVTQNSATQIKN